MVDVRQFGKWWNAQREAFFLFSRKAGMREISMMI